MKKSKEDRALRAKFWTTFSVQEFSDFIDRDGVLNEEQCARLWRMMEYQGEPPKSLVVQVHGPSLNRLIKQEHKR